MIYFVITVHVIVSLFLIVVILLQQGSSADLAGAFGGQGSQTAFGPRSASNALTKATVWAAVIFMITSITLTVMMERGAGQQHSVLQGSTTSAPASTPAKK
ncbi:MAG: preprotein translocase subunit SecG [Acidobacteriaceae bacterium]|jgi:preprotein translocase subunit SecG